MCLHFPVYYNILTKEILIDKEIEGHNIDEYVKIIPYQTAGVLGRWTWSREKMINERDYLIVEKVAGEYKLHKKVYSEQDNGRKPYTIVDAKLGRTELGSLEIKNIFDSKPFDYPKYSGFVKYLSSLIDDKNGIYMDFFSGSATTAHAVMQLNAEDGGNRKFICVQLPEKTEEDSEAYKAGYKNICEIGKERIRRAGKQLMEKIATTNASLLVDENGKVNKNFSPINIDTGFKVFKLDTSNLKKWNNAPTKDANEVAKRIQLSLDYLESGRTELDLVYEIMLKYGLDLTLPITKSSNGKAYIVNGEEYKLLICSEMNLTLDDIESFADESVGTYLFADRCFADDNLLINTQEILKSRNKEMRLF